MKEVKIAQFRVNDLVYIDSGEMLEYPDYIKEHKDKIYRIVGYRPNQSNCYLIRLEGSNNMDHDGGVYEYQMILIRRDI